MEYGLRHYEAVQRLFWFLFFLACLAVAYPLAKYCQAGPEGVIPASSVSAADAFKSIAFWMQTGWVRDKSFVGFAILYLVCVEVLFLIGRFFWLLAQHFAKHFVKVLLATTINKSTGTNLSPGGPWLRDTEKYFPKERLLGKLRKIPLSLLLHPVQRLRLMLNNPQATLSSEELSEKEHRIVETDWHLLWSSWAPFRWLLWVLPLLALMQSTWLLYFHLEPAITGSKDVREIIGPVFGSLVPLVQIVAAAIAFILVSGLLKRCENLYLSNLDALLYDQFLSRLPFQSSDTVILLEAMQKQFEVLQGMLRRMERSMAVDKGSQGDEG